MSDRNKIAQSLSVDKLDEFIRDLIALPGLERTYAGIQKHAAARGIVVSIEGAKSFRKTTFDNYVRRMDRRREFAERVASIQSDARATLADAAAENLAEQIFDLTEELADEANEEGGKLDLKKASSVAFIISKIRQGDVARSALQLKINDFERKERERGEKKAELSKTLDKEQKRGGISAETRALIDQELGALG
ncbi:MAG: DUF3486 family protein [Acidobacteria bacterium]|nr:DUF3486 family protein [Acidobacteriota bacterium]